MRYNVCDKCGASLDPGERCDCSYEEEKKRKKLEEWQSKLQSMMCEENNGQLKLAI